MNRCTSCRRRLWIPLLKLCGECRVGTLLNMADVPCRPCQDGPHDQCESPDYCPCPQKAHRPTVEEIEVRLIRLHARGVRQEVIDSLWQGGDVTLIAQLERATETTGAHDEQD